VILVGRSYGGKVVVEFATKHPDLVKGLVLIAPAIESGDVSKLSPTVTAKKVLVVAAEDDPIIPFAKSSANAKAFPHGQLVSLGNVLQPDAPASEKWKAHSAENVNVNEFRKAMESYVKELGA